jgi:hypothetical protein
MQRPEPQIVPLTADEKVLLMAIYQRHYKYLWTGFLISTFILSFISFTPFGLKVYAVIDDLVFDGKNTWMINENYLAGWYYKIGIAALISGILGVLSYYTSVLPYRLDVDSGTKLKVPYLVDKKEYFPITGQYFVLLQGIEGHYEVDAETYNKAEPGNTIYTSEAAKSKYIFSEDDEFMPFSF